MAVPAAGDWASHGRTHDQQRFSPLARIDRGNVGQRGLAWWAQFDTDRGPEATPLVQGGVLYTTTDWSKVHAFDARTGLRLWSFDPKVPGEKAFHACCDLVNRGPALWSGKLYVATLGGRLIALDAKTGEPLWKVATFNPVLPYTITGAPLVVKGLVLIGNAGADKSRRGYVSAYDGLTGKLKWRFFMAPHPQGRPDGGASDKPFSDFAGKSWGPGAWQQGGGGRGALCAAVRRLSPRGRLCAEPCPNADDPSARRLPPRGDRRGAEGEWHGLVPPVP